MARLTHIFAVLLFVGGLLASSSPVFAQARVITMSGGSTVRDVNVPHGQFVTVRTSADIEQLVVGDPEVASAVLLDKQSFYVLGKAAGRTNVAVHGAGDVLLGVMDVEVGADTDDLLRSIKQTVPNANVRVANVNGRLRLAGSVPDSIALNKVLELAQQYGSEGVINALRVTGGQQVLLEVRLLEANRNAGRDLGVSWFVRRANDSQNRGFFSGSVSRSNSGGAEYSTTLPTGDAPFGTVLAQVLGGGIKADVLIQALEQKGLARRLAEPNLVALSGETASFLAGGEVPIPVAGQNNEITVTYKEYGVRLNFTPIVLDGGAINLKLEPEVSQVDPTTTVRTGFVEVPAFTSRRASTTIEVRDGQSFVIAGLLQSVHTKSQDQLPWLGQLPVLGALFRSSSFQKEETDLVIIVTPHLVQPGKPGTPPRSPFDATKPANDPEFFLLGMMEVNDDMLKRFAQGQGVIGPYGHIIDVVPAKKSHVAKTKVVKP